MNYKIALIKGDGIGPEVVGEAVKMMDAVGEKFGHTFEYVDILMGAVPSTRRARATPTAPPRSAKLRRRPFGGGGRPQVGPRLRS